MKYAITATPNPVKFAPIVLCGPIEEAFQKAREYGYDGVEIHLRDTTDIDRTSVRALMRETGLAVTTLGTGIAAFEYQINFSHCDASMRERAVRHVEEFVDLAAELGSCITIGLMTGKLGRGDDREERRKVAIENIARAGSSAARHKVTILLEPLNRYECDYLNTIDDAAAVIREIGSANIRVLADTFHMNMEEVDIAGQLSRNIDSIGYIHLVDSNRQMPGAGHIRIPGIVRALHQNNYQGYLSFECLPIPDPETVAAGAIAFIKGL